MNDYIINSFIIQNKNTLNDIYEYIKNRYNSVDINDIQLELKKLIKNGIIFFNNIYELTTEGNVVLNDHKYYYSKIIIRFFKTYRKCRKYELREIRLEQQSLRKFLINNKKHECIICDKKLPLCLLETAHLKPRYLINYNEKYDNNVVEFMCRYCHTLYDNGFLSIYNGTLQISLLIDKYDIHYNSKTIMYYNSYNEKYFNYHYKYIFKCRINKN